MRVCGLCRLAAIVAGTPVADLPLLSQPDYDAHMRDVHPTRTAMQAFNDDLLQRIKTDPGAIARVSDYFRKEPRV